MNKQPNPDVHIILIRSRKDGSNPRTTIHDVVPHACLERALSSAVLLARKWRAESRIYDYHITVANELPAFAEAKRLSDLAWSQVKETDVFPTEAELGIGN